MRPRSRQDLIIFLIFISLVFFVCLVAFLAEQLWKVLTRRRARRITAPSREPKTPNWLRKATTTRVRLPGRGVRVQCRPYQKEVIHVKRKWLERRREAMIYAQQTVDDLLQEYGDRPRRIKLPDDTCTVSIPMEPFSCGVAPTEFRMAAASGGASGGASGASGASGEAGHYTYQMVGEERMQVTFYTEAGVTYTAGYCIYIPRPYDSNDYYSRHVLDRCYNGPKYSMEEERRFSEVDVLSALKWTLCPKRRIPVTIGMDRAAGRMRHFEWNGDVRAFRMIDCDACASSSSSVTIDDRPPAYESLDFDKV